MHFWLLCIYSLTPVELPLPRICKFDIHICINLLTNFVFLFGLKLLGNSRGLRDKLMKLNLRVDENFQGKQIKRSIVNKGRRA